MVNEKIFENQNYYVIVGITDEIKTPHYLVINKKYDVIEAETALYPQAIKYANDLDAAIFALHDIAKVPNNVSSLSKEKAN